jgi:Taurine catabolism dioxygenase TauD, TfdA family
LARESKAWLGTELAKGEVVYGFSPAAAAEIAGHLKGIDLLHDAGDGLAVRLDPEEAPLRRARIEIEELRRRVEDVHGFALVEPLAALEAPAERRALAWLIGRLLGEPIEQSREGTKIVQVYDRDRTLRMEDGARYHQTRQGGSIHTDNVNRPETWDYLVMACLFPAMIGGESIVVSGLTVHDFLRERAPRALDLLAENFWWECRGFSDDFFRAPILFFDDRGEPQFRYLREYLESAHRRAGEPLRDEQLWALDALDSALELSELQFRHKLAPGEILVIDDKQVFHGRTSFSDFLEAVPYGAGPGADRRPFRRCFDRLWIRRRDA